MSSDPLEIGEAAVEIYCEARTPEELSDQIRIQCSRRGKSITISECRPPWRPEAGSDWTRTKVAQLRFDPDAGEWSLYCSDSHGRWWPDDGIGPTASVAPLLAEIERDPTGIFWG